MVAEERTATRRRARRPTEAAARLDRLRRRNADQLAAQREAERRIETALQTYVDADVAISALERDKDDTVASLEQQIEQARTTAQGQIEQIRTQQAIAVWHISDAGRTVEQIAQLLEVSPTEARRLLRTGRTVATRDATAGAERASTPPENTALGGRPEQPSEQGELSGVDRHQDGLDASLVPPIADSGGQCS